MQRYIEQFEKTGPRRRGEPAWLAANRRSAIERAATIGFPTLRDEEWRYTNVGPALEIPYQADGSRSPLSKEELKPLPFAGTTLFVFVNGHFVPELSDKKIERSGITIQPVKKVVAENPSWLEPFFPPNPAPDTDPSLPLNPPFFGEKKGSSQEGFSATTFLT